MTWIKYQLSQMLVLDKSSRRAYIISRITSSIRISFTCRPSNVTSIYYDDQRNEKTGLCCRGGDLARGSRTLVDLLAIPKEIHRCYFRGNGRDDRR